MCVMSQFMGHSLQIFSDRKERRVIRLACKVCFAVGDVFS